MHQYYGFILITYINKTWPTSAIYKNLLNEASIDVLSPAWNREKKFHHSITQVLHHPRKKQCYRSDFKRIKKAAD